MPAPGVTVTISNRPGAANPDVPISARYFVAGQAERGPTNRAVECASHEEFMAQFGASRTSYGAALWDASRIYFAEGGGKLVVGRTAGPAAVIANVMINDGAGTPVPTIRPYALGPGSYANGWKIVVANGTVSNSRKITITDANDVVLAGPYDNLTTPAAIATLNTGAVTFVDQNSATAAPNNLPAVGTYTLASGTDDRGNITGEHYVNTLALFTADYEAGLVDVPGIAGNTVAGSSTVGAGVLAHAKTFQRLAFINPAVGQTDTAVRSDVATWVSATSEKAIYAWPWVKYADGVDLRTCSPGAYVAAVRCRAHLEEGPLRRPGGDIAAARFITGLERDVTDTVHGLCADAKISVIRYVGGKIALYGYESLSTDTLTYPDAAIADFLNTLSYAAANAVRPFLFRTIDGRGVLASAVKGALVGLVSGYAAKGLYPRYLIETSGRKVKVDDGYDVRVDDQALAQIQAGILPALLAVRPAPYAKWIPVTIVNAGIAANLN